MAALNWAGETLELELGDPAHGGFCVARHEGRVVFVRYGIPGERVRALVTEDGGGRHCFAEAVTILRASPGRVEPACPISGPGGAGCCDLAHIDVATQRAVKTAVVSGQLRRIAHLDARETEPSFTVEPLLDSSSPTGWRTRVRLGVSRDGMAGFRRLRSNELVTALRCAQPVPGLLSGLDSRRWTPGSELQVVADGDGERHVVEIAPAETAWRGGMSGDTSGVSAQRRRRTATSRRARRERPRSERVVEGSGRAVEFVSGWRFEVAATGFWQAHFAAAECYSGVVREWSQLSEGQHAWDLYSGAGVFASVLGSLTGPRGTVEAVESSPSSIRDGEESLANMPQVRFHQGATERVISTLTTAPSVVVLDPPRSGAGKGVISKVAAAQPRSIIHIGCDPAAFARDCALYGDAGYRLARLRAFDAFPLTHHVECIGMFVK